MTSKLGKLVLFTVFGALLLLGLLEGSFRIYRAFVPENRIAIDFDGGFSETSRLFVLDPKDPAYLITNPSKVYSFHSQRFRSRKPDGTCRIAFVGESSVNYLQSEFERLRPRFQTVLSERCKNVEVLNAGGLSYGSQRLARVATELLNYNPDIVALYIGHNEFEEVEQFELIRPRYAWISRMAMSSALVRALSTELLSLRVSKLEREHLQRLLSGTPNVDQAWRYKFTMEEVNERMRAFERNLEGVLQAYARAKVPLILSTIPSNLVNPYLPAESAQKYQVVHQLIAAGQFAKAREQGEALLMQTPGRHQSSELENEIVRRLAKKYDRPLVDIKAAIVDAEPHYIPGETLFKDHCHLNEQGNRMWIQTMAPAIVRELEK